MRSRHRFIPGIHSRSAHAIALLATLPSIASANFLSGTGGAPTDPIFLAPIIETFDTATPGSYNSLTLVDNTFIGVDGPFIISPLYITQYNTNGINSLQTGSVVSPINPLLPSIIKVKFTIPVSALAFNWGASDNIWQMDAYDSSNNLLESDLITTLTSNSNAGDYFGIAAPGIKTLILTDLKNNYPNGDYILIDDFTTSFETTAPEPATIMLLGVAGVAMLRGRKRWK